MLTSGLQAIDTCSYLFIALETMGLLGLPHMIPFAKSFASSWAIAIASGQVSGTKTPWRKNAFWVVLPFWFFLPRKCRFEIFEQKMVTDKKGFKNYTTVDPKQWVDSRSALRNWVKHMK